MPEAGGTRPWSALAMVFAAGILGCASAPPPPAEPARFGLGSVPSPVAPPAAASAGAAGGTDPTGGGAQLPRRSEVACPARIAPGVVGRSALTRTLDAGLGSWLRGVDVEPQIEDGRFQGWRVRAIHPGDPCWADVDLRPGDVVSRINRRPIERPEEAQAVWSALRGAGEIVVELVRGREARTLRFAVMDDSDGN